MVEEREEEDADVVHQWVKEEEGHTDRGRGVEEEE